MAQIGECLRLTLVSRLKALAEDNQIPLRRFNMYTLSDLHLEALSRLLAPLGLSAVLCVQQTVNDTIKSILI